MISEQEILDARILIVDDQRSIVLVLEKLLRMAGYTCISTTLESQAVCALHLENRFDLILLDLNMPGIDGFQVMEGLKQIEMDDYLPVLVISSESDQKLRALAAGAKDFVTKPFNLDELQTRIHNMLEVRLLYKKLMLSNQALGQIVQKRAVELRETKALLHRNQALMLNAMDGIHIMDMQGNIVDENDAFCRKLGYTRQEMARLNVADFDAQWTCEELQERFKWLVSRNTRFETVYRRKDGSLINVEVSTSGVEIDGQQFLFAASRDITERKHIELKLMTLNDQLKHDVARRTADLSALTAHIQNIAETERAHLARELHDEMGSTLTGLSMEFGRLKSKITDTDCLQDLTVIQELLSNATRIAREVVNQLYPTFLDTYGFVAAVDWLVKEFRKHAGIEVELLIPDEDIVIEQAYALAAYRITQECLTNISRHAEASKVHIEVKAANGMLDVSIRDNGKGLPDKISANRHGIFGMKERARNMGGSMEIGSGGGGGTIARLSLPMASVKPETKKRVLVIDDHAIVRDALRQLLDDQTDDFSVDGEAADGKAGSKMAIEEIWDIILLDITMPKKNGIKVLEEIKAAKPSQPIIMLSSHGKDEYANIALAKGAADYIEKGETSKLVAAMRRATINL